MSTYNVCRVRNIANHYKREVYNYVSIDQKNLKMKNIGGQNVWIIQVIRAEARPTQKSSAADAIRENIIMSARLTKNRTVYPCVPLIWAFFFYRRRSRSLNYALFFPRIFTTDLNTVSRGKTYAIIVSLKFPHGRIEKRYSQLAVLKSNLTDFMQSLRAQPKSDLSRPDPLINSRGPMDTKSFFYVYINTQTVKF